MNKFIAHILVVDDDDGIRSLVKQYLAANNFLVTTANSAEEASEKISIIKFDLIVLDIMMPGKNGLEFTRENKKKINTPIILLTAKGETDEFITPMILANADEQRIVDEDVVFWFNFRADRARQLCNAFLNGEAFVAFDKEVHPKPYFVTLTQYDEIFDCEVVYPSSSMKNVLGEVVADAGLSQLRIAETEKYPHVTYFFNGGAETPFMDEDRQIVASPAVATYDLQPEMSAPEVTEKLVARLKDYDLVILNFANPDMVGHTGIVEACNKACVAIDKGVQAVVEETLRLGGKLLITADHGNCEKLINADGSPHTAHTTNLVHAIYVADDYAGVTVNDGILADVAPTLLDMLGVAQPEEMTGKSMLVK